MSFLEKILDKLTGNYNQSNDSNIRKLFVIVSDQYDEIKSLFVKIEDWRDIDKAEGAVLDRIGRNVMEYRGSSNDERFRQLIKTRIRANLSSGDIETLNEVMGVLLGDNFLGVREGWNQDPYGNEPASLFIEYIPERDFPKIEVFFDGQYSFDGTALYNGTESNDYESETVLVPKEAMKRMVAGGIRIYWLVPEKPITKIEPIHDTSFLLNYSSSNQPLQSLTHNTSSLVKTTTTQERPTFFDGTMHFNGGHYYDGQRSDVVFQTGLMKVYKSGTLSEEVVI